MGMIALDSEQAKEIGFTSDKFISGSYLWDEGNEISISFIGTKLEGAGHLSQLFKSILNTGKGIAVPAPFPKMERILMRKGFNRETDNDPVFGPVEVWRKQKTRVYHKSRPRGRGEYIRVQRVWRMGHWLLQKM